MRLGLFWWLLCGVALLPMEILGVPAAISTPEDLISLAEAHGSQSGRESGDADPGFALVFFHSSWCGTAMTVAGEGAALDAIAVALDAHVADKGNPSAQGQPSAFDAAPSLAGEILARGKSTGIPPLNHALYNFDSEIAVVTCNATASSLLRALFSPQLPSLVLVDLSMFSLSGAGSGGGGPSVITIGMFGRSPAQVALRARRAAAWLRRKASGGAVFSWPPGPGDDNVTLSAALDECATIVSCVVLTGHPAGEDGASGSDYFRDIDLDLDLDEAEDDEEEDTGDDCVWPNCRTAGQMKFAKAFYKAALVMGAERHFFRLTGDEGGPAFNGGQDNAQGRIANVKVIAGGVGVVSRSPRAPSLISFGPSGPHGNFTAVMRGHLDDTVLEFKHSSIGFARGKLALVAFADLGGGQRDREADADDVPKEPVGGHHQPMKSAGEVAIAEHTWKHALRHTLVSAGVNASSTVAMLANGRSLAPLLRRMGWQRGPPAVACIDAEHGGHFWMETPVFGPENGKPDISPGSQAFLTAASDFLAAVAAADGHDISAVSAPNDGDDVNNREHSVVARHEFADASWHDEGHQPAASPAHGRPVPYVIYGDDPSGGQSVDVPVSSFFQPVGKPLRKSIQELRDAGRAVVLLVHTAHCMHCQLMLSAMTVVAERYCSGKQAVDHLPRTNSIVFIALDALAFRATALQFGVSAVPETLLFPATNDPSDPPVVYKGTYSVDAFAAFLGSTVPSACDFSGQKRHTGSDGDAHMRNGNADAGMMSLTKDELRVLREDVFDIDDLPSAEYRHLTGALAAIRDALGLEIDID